MQAELAFDYFHSGPDAHYTSLARGDRLSEGPQLTINATSSVASAWMWRKPIRSATRRAPRLRLAVGGSARALDAIRRETPGDFAIRCPWPRTSPRRSPLATVGAPELRPYIAASERRMAAANAQIGVAKRLLSRCYCRAGVYESTKMTSLFAFRPLLGDRPRGRTLFELRTTTRHAGIGPSGYDGVVAGDRQTV